MRARAHLGLVFGSGAFARCRCGDRKVFRHYYAGVCFFFPRRANKKGAPLVPVLAVPTNLANREISVLHLFKCIAALVCIHTRARLKMLRVHFAVAGFREMPLSVHQITTRLAKPTRRQQESANGSSAALRENAQMFPPFYLVFCSCVKKSRMLIHLFINFAQTRYI